MKKAINVWSYTNKTVKECMTLAKEAGYDGIELSLDEDGPTGLDATLEDWANIKAYADELGLALPCVATGLYGSYPFTSEDEKVREKGISIAIKQMEIAKALGADSILVVPGAVNVHVSYDVAYDRALAALMRLKTHAEALQVRIAIENVWNQFLLSPLEMRDFIDKIDSLYVGAYFDVGNVIAIGFPEQWIKILGKRIFNVHFKDYRRVAGGFHGFVDLLAGDVNWPAVMDAFESVGYDGWAIAEMLPHYLHYPDQMIWNTFTSMTRIMG